VVSGADRGARSLRSQCSLRSHVVANSVVEPG
jgi:hypothetical protein